MFANPLSTWGENQAVRYMFAHRRMLPERHVIDGEDYEP
jgi:hypothetical protein